MTCEPFFVYCTSKVIQKGWANLNTVFYTHIKVQRIDKNLNWRKPVVIIQCIPVFILFQLEMRFKISIIFVTLRYSSKIKKIEPNNFSWNVNFLQRRSYCYFFSLLMPTIPYTYSVHRTKVIQINIVGVLKYLLLNCINNNTQLKVFTRIQIIQKYKLLDKKVDY